MRRGTTPTLSFTTPYTAEMVQSGYITFKQRGAIVLEKELSDPAVTVLDNKIKLDLTQAETLLFSAACPCKVQARLILATGKRAASCVVTFDPGEILKEGEI